MSWLPLVTLSHLLLKLRSETKGTKLLSQHLQFFQHRQEGANATVKRAIPLIKKVPISISARVNAQRSLPAFWVWVIVHAGDRGSGPGAISLLLNSPLVRIADSDVQDLHTWGSLNSVGEPQRSPQLQTPCK